jgi:hypothetical protein
MLLIACELMRMELIEQKANRRSAAEFALPADVTEWVGHDLVRGWVLDETGTFDWEHPALQEFLRTHPDFHPRELLCLLTFAYATAVFESEDIVAHCYRDPAWRRLVKGNVPTAAEIGKFRKENRGLLKWCLAQVFKRALRTRFELGELIPAGIRQYLVRDAGERLDLARHMDRAAQGA